MEARDVLGARLDVVRGEAPEIAGAERSPDPSTIEPVGSFLADVAGAIPEGVGALFATAWEIVSSAVVLVWVWLRWAWYGISDVVGLLILPYLCAWTYIDDAARRDALTRQLTALLQHLAEKGYRRCHLLTSSFGSIIAIDALFPSDARERSGYEQVASLFTVGCPFDLVNTYFRHFFADRQIAREPEQWVNVFSRHDVLGSDFHKGFFGAGSEACIRIAQGASGMPPCPHTHLEYVAGRPHPRTRVLQVLTLYGFRTHSMYWAKDVDDEDALAIVVPHLVKAS